MKEAVKAYIINNGMIVRGDTIWVALSGGADSSCLLHLLNGLKAEIGFVLKAVHINHLLRGKESDRDEAFCRNICVENGIDIEVYSADVKKIAADEGLTIEQGGRRVRYNIFSKKCDGKVATAHNMNDNAETVLMNLMRGSGTVGLCGISPVKGKYIRPLIKTTRESIEKYCMENEIDYITDSSNDDTVFFRNAVRHKVIPLLNEITGKEVVPVLDRAADSIDIDNSFIETAADEAFNQLVKTNKTTATIDNKGILTLHPALSARVVRKAVEYAKGNLKDIESRHVSLLADIITENRTGGAVNLPDGVSALVQFGKTLVYRDIPTAEYEYKLPIPGKIFIKEKNLDIIVEICETHGKADPKGDVHYFSQAVCEQGLYVRNRRNGDIIKPWKGRGTAKLKKYFIDRKIERPARDSLLVIACGSSIAYIEGLDYGKEFIPADDDRIIKVTFERR